FGTFPRSMRATRMRRRWPKSRCGSWQGGSEAAGHNGSAAKAASDKQPSTMLGARPAILGRPFAAARSVTRRSQTLSLTLLLHGSPCAGMGIARGQHKKQKSHPSRVAFLTFEAPGSVLLLHGECQTTIGAGAFHFRVRDGIGWDHTAMAARESARCAQEVRGISMGSGCDECLILA